MMTANLFSLFFWTEGGRPKPLNLAVPLILYCSLQLLAEKRNSS